jgi:hypothetical protein
MCDSQAGMSSRYLAAALPLVVFACAPAESAPPGSSEADATAASSVVEGSPEAVGVLAFLNHESTDVAILDHEVPLPSHAAKNLIAHRDGPDGQLGTADDDRYDTVTEILGVPQVGASRLQAIIDYAAANGFVPTGSDLLGVYDDVPFTVDDAERTLELCNTASETLLDDTIALDSRAVESILEARPIGSILQLSGLHYVGTSALGKLKAWGAPPDGATEGEDCASSAACSTGLQCVGIPFDGSAPIGKCVDMSPIPGEGDDCGVFAGACMEDLECVGTTVYNGEGYCRPLWMVGSFSATAGVAIPDGDAAGVSLPIQVYGLASVPEDIVVTLDIDHPRPQDLVVTLIASNQSSAVLWNHQASPDAYLSAGYGIERDNFVNGEWTLHVADTVGGEVGQLGGVTLLISSRWD